MSMFAQLLKGGSTPAPVRPVPPPRAETVKPVRTGLPSPVTPESLTSGLRILPPVTPESLNLPAVRPVAVPALQLHDTALRTSVTPESPDYSLRKRPEDHTPEARALRDEKIEYIRAVWDLHRTTRCPEGRACAVIAETRAADFPRLSKAGKKGSSALRYNNYRNWINGCGDKPGLGRLNDGTPDYRNADVLLRNYAIGGEHELYGDPAFWTAICGLYLQTKDQYLAKAYRHLRWGWEIDNPDQIIPTLAQVRNGLRRMFPSRMALLARKGENAYDQLVRNYIERDPDSLRPGEAWVADTKDCDFTIRIPATAEDNEGKRNVSAWRTIRPKLVVLMDIKSQFPVSVQLIDGNCNNAVIRNGFAAAVRRFGRPKIFLTDNGSDYCKAGFGDPVVFTPAVNGSKVYEHSILRELDVEHDKSLPYNARAKIVERFFREVAGYERDTRGYVGNMPEHRPATADVWTKIKGREYLNSVDEACQWLGELVMIYLNTPSNGKYLKGLTPLQAFRPEIRYKRADMTEAEYIRAFRMPLSEPKKLDYRGPSVRLDGERYVVIPEDKESAWRYDGKLVMIKTTLIDKSRIHIYGLDGTYIAECRTVDKTPYFHAPAELLAEQQREINAERVALRARIMDATGGWHLIDGQTIYQQPREAFLGSAPVKLLDTAMSVGGESHNPRIHILKSEEREPTALPEKVVCSKTRVTPESLNRIQLTSAEQEDIKEVQSILARPKKLQEDVSDEELAAVHDIIRHTNRGDNDDEYCY